jgi:hypothetical protein
MNVHPLIRGTLLGLFSAHMRSEVYNTWFVSLSLVCLFTIITGYKAANK